MGQSEKSKNEDSELKMGKKKKMDLEELKQEVTMLNSIGWSFKQYVTEQCHTITNIILRITPYYCHNF
ncbi:hypothetical protein NPIL_87831 [Nephila pilipes]|uniref:Uncharacterized protein n=1 Tax=Nephila pilipes TaxID=299642 RepID=A0A8X6P2C1_NEPPI|nr:hypothetical protein NPIL_87831 [Nephila pilipes]